MALSSATVNDVGGAAQDLMSGYANSGADKAKAVGAGYEAANYGMAATLAGQNAQYTEESTAIQELQQTRTNYQQYSGAQSDIAGAGLRESGSAISILRDNAQQGQLALGVIQKQGQITEEGYQEQQSSYENLQKAALAQQSADNEAAKESEEGGWLGAAFKGVAAIASLF